MTSTNAKPDNRADLWRQIQREEPALAALLKEAAQVFGRVRNLHYEPRNPKNEH